MNILIKTNIFKWDSYVTFKKYPGIWIKSIKVTSQAKDKDFSHHFSITVDNVDDLWTWLRHPINSAAAARNKLTRMIQDQETQAKAKSEGKLKIYVSNPKGQRRKWKLLDERRKRPIESVFLPQDEDESDLKQKIVRSSSRFIFFFLPAFFPCCSTLALTTSIMIFFGCLQN